MKKKKNKKAVGKTALTKSLKELVKDEDGFVSKETILKVGLATVAALGMTHAMTDNAPAQHNNQLTADGDNCVTHTNITQHSSY